MRQVIKHHERGHANHSWLDSHHTFSFADYYNPAAMGVSHLRVINEDRVTAGAGFPTHAHQSMEIISYVLEGGLEHKDSMGTGSVIRPGDVQLMSAGTGVTHSEYNASQSEGVHFLQIWLIPSERGGAPRYEQKHFSVQQRQGQLQPVATSDGREGSLTLKQDASLYASLLQAGEAVTFEPRPGRLSWVQVAKGELLLNEQLFVAGDGICADAALPLAFSTPTSAEFLLFDLKDL